MTDKSIEYWAHMLDEAYDKNIVEADNEEKQPKDDKDDNKNNEQPSEQKTEKKIDAKRLVKDIMVLEPATALKFVAKQYDDSDPKAFLLKNLVPFTVYAVKNGFVKAKDIGMSVKDFNKKNKADATEIDFKTVDIDEDTMKKIYVIDDDVLKKLEDFVSQYKDTMKDAQKEIESTSEKLDKDIKDAEIKLDEDQLADNAMVVAGVIDKPENKKLPKKDKQKKVEAAIDAKKQVKKLTDAAEKASKKKIKADPKFEKMSDKELSKLNDDIEKKTKTKSDTSKQNDALRSKLKSAVQKGVANDFKKSVKTQFLSSKNFKNMIAKNLKSGPKAENIDADRVVCVSVQCKKSDFKKILSEAKDSKVIDISTGSKNKAIQKLVDHIKDAVKKTVGDKDISDFYVYRKQSTKKEGVDILYVFAGVKTEALNEAIVLAEASKALGMKALAAIVKYKKEHGLPDNMSSLSPKDSMAIRKLPDVAAWLKQGGVSGKTLRTNGLSKIIMKSGDIINGDGKFAKMDRALLGLPMDQHVDISNIDDVASSAKDTAKTMAGQATDDVAAEVEDVANNVKVPAGFQLLPNGKMLPSFNYQSLSHQINDIEGMMKDGVIDKAEEANIIKLQDSIYKYSDWAVENQNSDDPNMRQKAQLICMLRNRLNSKIDKIDQLCAADEANSIAERVPDAANTSKEVAKLANNEETKQAADGLLGKFGKVLKTFGQAVAVAKIAKFALNNSKTLIDACGGMAMKFKENKDSIAQITVLVNNGNDSDQKFSDTRFGVYFSADDLKWHATNIDDRKMKIDDEEDLIKRVLDTNTGKEFKKEALSKLQKLFEGEDGKTMKYFVNNYKELGIKADKDVQKMFDKLKNIAENFDEVKKQFS